MTDQDERRVEKALQGVDLPADNAALVGYAESRGASSKTLQALRALPGGTYRTIDEVLDAVPAEPEGDEPGGTGRPDVRNSPSHRP